MARAGSRVGILAAGERWLDGSLRPAFEDLVGAGAVIAAINDAKRTPEAAAAEAAFAHAASELLECLSNCTSGRELREAGYDTDVSWVAELDQRIPRFDNGQYMPLP